jgi:hypothetical protein
VGEYALNLVERHIAESEITQADFVIHPKVAHVHWNNFIQLDKRENGIYLGEEAANDSITQIKLKITQNNITRILQKWMKKIRKLL